MMQAVHEWTRSLCKLKAFEGRLKMVFLLLWWKKKKTCNIYDVECEQELSKCRPTRKSPFTVMKYLHKQPEDTEYAPMKLLTNRTARRLPHQDLQTQATSCKDKRLLRKEFLFLKKAKVHFSLQRNAFSSLPGKEKKEASWRHVKFFWSKRNENNCTSSSDLIAFLDFSANPFSVGGTSERDISRSFFSEATKWNSILLARQKVIYRLWRVGAPCSVFLTNEAKWGMKLLIR